MSTVWIRVSDKRTGHQYTISESAFDPGIHVKLKSSPVDLNGDPRLPKHKVSLEQVVQDKNQTTETVEGSEGVN